MQLFRFFILILILPCSLLAQDRTKIILRESEVLDGNLTQKMWKVKKPVFLHEGAVMTCDSARFWRELNYFEAFGNVHINQDTININSDQLNYDGNTKIAHLINNVRMSDPSSVLTTSTFDYNLATRIGTYLNQGKIINKEGVTITSKKGYYFSGTKDAYFRYNVVVVSEQATVKSDTLRYNTLTDDAYIYGPTDILGKDDKLYTERGKYNTKSEIALATKNNVYTQGSKTLRGDSLYYDGKKGYGRASRDIVFNDSKDKLTLKGQLGEYYKEKERTIVTKNAFFAIATNDSVMINGAKVPDTLWLGADTLEAEMVLQKTLKIIPFPKVVTDDEIGQEAEVAPAKQPLPDGTPKKEVKATLNAEETEPPSAIVKAKPDSLLKADSLKIPADTTKKPTGLSAPAKQPALSGLSEPPDPADTVKSRIIKAYHRVKVFKKNLQARADSLFFAAADSTLRLYQNPIIWSDSTQQTGDTIHVQLLNKKINNAQIFQNAFIANQLSDTTKFNQIKGKIITAYFNENGDMETMYVDGNAESVKYDKDKDNKPQINQTISARIKVEFADKEIQKVNAIKGVEGTFSPASANIEEVILTGFVWKPEDRPKSKEEITGITKAAVKQSSPKAQPKAPASAKPKPPAKRSKPAKNSPAATPKKIKKL